ncbi:cold-shock protein [Jannaschia formosa]|uniref:cold-shock protein n=1 Tax=Jannaschia formosa TaxID=2259592 RepID=UPI000E1C010E|nr:cold shock domain-containing protein [Jannaschia formosa]TFL18696.1 hypothetical protein DR046_07145 [Jannaschia formosa]
MPKCVKWADRGKGFGFANAFREEGDFFVHMSVLQRCDLQKIGAGEAIGVNVIDGERGPEAGEMLRWNA